MRSPIWLRLISEVPPAMDMPRCISTMKLLMPAAPSMNAASLPWSSGLDRDRLVAELGEDQLRHRALGPGTGRRHGPVGAAQVEEPHGGVVGDVATHSLLAPGQPLRVRVEHAGRVRLPGIDMPPPPPPMLTLSLPSVARATVQPPSTGPTTSSSGTKTSLKKTSLNSELPVVIFSGRTSTPLRVHVDHDHRDALVLGHVGVRADGGEAEAGVVRAAGPDLLAVDEPAAVDPGALGLDAGGVGAGVGLAEELAPDDFLVQRRHDPAVELVLVGVLDQREDVPGGDAVRRVA